MLMFLKKVQIFSYIAPRKLMIIMLQKRYILTLIFVFGLLIQSLLAQDKNPVYFHYGKFKDDAKEKLFFRFENLNFVKNNEYQEPYADGYTLLGYIATPKLVYYPTSNLSITAGTRLQKYSGLDNFSEIEPVFTIHYQPNPKLSLILGTLNQNDNHKLHEALFEPERYFTNKAENGLQALYESKIINFDAWINWEQFIFQNDPFQEVFTFGLSAGLRLNNPESSHSLSMPMQVLFTHKGGEIDFSDDKVQTIRHLGTGLVYKKTFESSRMRNFNAEVLYFQFSDNSSFKEFVFDKGKGFHFRIGAETKHSYIKLGYWLGDKFNSSRGSALFQSVSVVKRTHVEKRRDLLTAKYRYQKPIADGILLGGQLDVYSDLNTNGEISAAASLFVRINGEFFLRKLAWKN